MNDIYSPSISWNKHNISVLRSIILIAKKYNLDKNQLTEALVLALRNGIFDCGNLKVQCRQINQESATFLITAEETIVSQFPIKLEILENWIK